MNKKWFLVLFLLLFSIPLFASGAAEQLSQMVQYAGTGAGVGSIFGPVGTFAGAAVGLISGAVSGGLAAKEKTIQKALNYKSYYLEQQQTINELEAQNELAKAQITEAERTISNYDQTLAEWSTTQELAETELYSSAKSQYNTLMDNFANLQTVLAAKGQTGGSAEILQDIAKQDVVDYVGEDLTLNKNDNSTFAKIWEKNESDWADQKASILLGKQDLYSTIENYKKSITSNNASIKTATGLAEDYKTLADEYKSTASRKYGVKIN